MIRPRRRSWAVRSLDFWPGRAQRRLPLSRYGRQKAVGRRTCELCGSLRLCVAYFSLCLRIRSAKTQRTAKLAKKPPPYCLLSSSPRLKLTRFEVRVSDHEFYGKEPARYPGSVEHGSFRASIPEYDQPLRLHPRPLLSASSRKPLARRRRGRGLGRSISRLERANYRRVLRAECGRSYPRRGREDHRARQQL